MACLIAPLTLRADIYIKQKNHTDGFSVMGQSQPAKDDLFVTWMGKEMARLDYSEESSTIVRLDKKVMYLVNHKEKTYTEIPIGGKGDIISGALAGAGLSGEEEAQAKKMMEGFAKMMKPEITVTETGETQQIKGWNCKKYDMTTSMMGATTQSEIWASEDIKIDYELYLNLTSSMISQAPGFEDMVKEMQKIKGVVVRQLGTISMMGTNVKTSQELVEVAEKPAPGGTYDVPGGYQKQK